MPFGFPDPTGHFSWKQFWGGVEDFFKEKVLPPVISFATAFVFSGGNPIAASAAAISTILLDTGSGRKIVGNIANEVFDDVFGMRPQAARFWSYFAADAVLTAGISYGLDNTFDPSNAQVVKQDKLTKGQLEEFKNILTDKKAMTETLTNGRGLSQISSKNFKALVVDGHVKALIANSPVQILGIPIPLIEHTAAAIPGGGKFDFNWFGSYGINGVCHQGRVAALNSIGINVNPLNLSWHPSTLLSYGIYGESGQLGGVFENAAKAYYFND